LLGWSAAACQRLEIELLIAPVRDSFLSCPLSDLRIEMILVGVREIIDFFRESAFSFLRG
jgi:hypothetical protein